MGEADPERLRGQPETHRHHRRTPSGARRELRDPALVPAIGDPVHEAAGSPPLWPRPRPGHRPCRCVLHRAVASGPDWRLPESMRSSFTDRRQPLRSLRGATRSRRVHPVSAENTQLALPGKACPAATPFRCSRPSPSESVRLTVLDPTVVSAAGDGESRAGRCKLGLPDARLQATRGRVTPQRGSAVGGAGGSQTWPNAL